MKKRTLVVLESWGDAESYCRQRRLKYYKMERTAEDDIYGEMVFCPASELRSRICGYQFYAVIFYDGMYSSQEIMYALSRQRYSA
jgi:hypothetical protein